ncbi:hypothetical protein TELCIR_03651 [Teladorsagia circumcincta]|uniref:Uncharacterized protein n=1 Tax=Teladorsagia circumcincta TaxID=45464 RepID=A0A2G9UXB7_TELCI|nr:hypothetical protein TELCIR_03651 [Teladorsagia circumcincta]
MKKCKILGGICRSASVCYITPRLAGKRRSMMGAKQSSHGDNQAYEVRVCDKIVRDDLEFGKNP